MSSYPQRWRKGRWDGPRDKAVQVHRAACVSAHRKREAADRDQAIHDLLNVSVQRISHTAMLRNAWDECRRGGHAPGPNGRTYGDFTDEEIWEEVRELSDRIDRGCYRPGRDRLVSLPKESGGFRELRLQDIQDRVAAKSVVLVLQPLLDPKFDPRSFGFRPLRDPTMRALVYVERLASSEGRWAWAKCDIAQAFDRVPHGRLLDAIDRRLPCPQLRSLLEAMIANRANRGLRQGSPLSPLLLNLYLDHYLDKPWRELHPDLPLVRYGDDLILLGKNRREVTEAQDALKRRLVGLGLPLNDDKTRIRRMAGSQPQRMQWLGYDLRHDGSKLVARIGPSTWKRLKLQLERLHLEPDPPLRAPRVIRGWINHRGAEFEHEDHERVLDRVVRMATDLGFEEIPSRQRLHKDWEASYGRLQRLRGPGTASSSPKPLRRPRRPKQAPEAELRHYTRGAHHEQA